LNGLQKSLIASAIRQNSDNPTDPVTVANSTAQANALQTYEHAINFMHPDAPRLTSTGIRGLVDRVLSLFSL